MTRNLSTRTGPLTGRTREYHRIADHQAVAARAKAHPGQWQRVGMYQSAEVARSTGTHVRAGRLAAYRPAGHFEAYQTLGREGRELWVRYVHDSTSLGELPEQLPQSVAVLMAAHQTVDRYVSARWAVNLLDRHGYAEDAARVRGWLEAEQDGHRSARQAAAYLLQTNTTREDTDQ